MLASESLAMLKVSNWETVLLRSHLPLVASGRAHSTAPWPLTRRDFFGVISFTFGHMGNRVISYNIYIYTHTKTIMHTCKYFGMDTASVRYVVYDSLQSIVCGQSRV